MQTGRVSFLLSFVLALASAWTVTAQSGRPAKPGAPLPAAGPTDPAAIQAPPGTPAPAIARYDPQNRRDPFLNPVLIRKIEASPDEEIDRGQGPPGIAGMSVTKVSLLGVSTRDGGKTAVFRGSDNRAYFLQQGDKFHDGYLQSIGDDSVVLVRQRHYRSGKVVSDEITKRLRMP